MLAKSINFCNSFLVINPALYCATLSCKLIVLYSLLVAVGSNISSLNVYVNN